MEEETPDEPQIPDSPTLSKVCSLCHSSVVWAKKLQQIFKNNFFAFFFFKISNSLSSGCSSLQQGDAGQKSYSGTGPTIEMEQETLDEPQTPYSPTLSKVCSLRHLSLLLTLSTESTSF
jgi:uncharacterized protein YceK